LDFADYVDLETAVKNNDEKKVSVILNLGQTEGANPYASAPQQSAPIQKNDQQNNQTQNSNKPEDLFKKGDEVSFVDSSGERVEGELDDLSTTSQAKVSTPAGSKNVNPADLELNLDSDDADLNRMKKLAGIEEKTVSSGVNAGAIHSGSLSTTPMKSTSQIAKDNHQDQKPGPKPKKKKLIKR